jgi:5'-nucleotidase / UDP-sugar diphosphatase
MKKSSILLICTLLTLWFRPDGILAQCTTEVIFLHTNDMHSKIDNMARLAFLADSLRSRHPNVFLVSAGDNFTGNPVVDMVKETGYPMIDLMNHCGFNLSALGNHEFDMGQDMLNRRMKQANFKFISSNIDASRATVRQPKPYIILKAGKVKIPVLGIIQLGENGMPDSHPSRLTRLSFRNGMESTADYTWLKKKYGMMIGLTHLGIEVDEPLALKYPQFDLIIGGHSHTTMIKPVMAGDVMIVQAGSGLRNVGKTTLQIRDGKIIERSFELIPLDKVTGFDPAVQALIDIYNDNEELNEVIGSAVNPLNGEHELGSLMTDAITSRLGVDFAFQNIGGIRVSSLPAGDIRLKDIYRLDPFGNQVVIFKMTIPEIKSLICNAYNRSKEIDLEVSGMSYTVILAQDGTCRDVEMLDRSGQPLDESAKYTVGVNSYISASYKFDHKDAGNTMYSTSAQALIEYLKEVKKVDYSGVKRTSVR